MNISDLNCAIELDGDEMTPVVGGAGDYFLQLAGVPGESQDDSMFKRLDKASPLLV
jgi:hypothetical protein